MALEISGPGAAETAPDLATTYWEVATMEDPNSPRLWSKLDKDCPGGCWVWTAGKSKLGYGRIRWEGRAAFAHRVVYEIVVGPIPEGLELDHLCRNPSCVNPQHLEPVTHAENVRRGESISSIHRAKTHCPRGHPYSGPNLIIDGGSRKCRTCVNVLQKVNRAKRLARATA